MIQCRAWAVLLTASVLLGLSSVGARKLSQKQQQHPSAFIPEACRGAALDTSVYVQGSTVRGSVAIHNTAASDFLIQYVVVQLNSNAGVDPISTVAICPDHTVPAVEGVVTCNFTVTLPGTGPAASPSAWSTLQAAAYRDVYGMRCNGVPTPIIQPWTPASRTCPSSMLVAATYTDGYTAIDGTVLLYNNARSNITLTNPLVQIHSSAKPSYPPLFGALWCTDNVVPAAADAGSIGTLFCHFYVDVAATGQPWSLFDTALAKLALHGSGTVCTSPGVSVAPSLLGSTRTGGVLVPAGGGGGRGGSGSGGLAASGSGGTSPVAGERSNRGDGNRLSSSLRASQGN